MLSHRLSLTLLFAGVTAAAALSACGGAGSSPSSAPASSATSPAATATTAPTPTPTVAPLDTTTCPSASVVGTALGTTLPAPTQILQNKLASALPSGTGAIACKYQAATQLVVLGMFNKMAASLFTIDQVAVETALGVSGVTFIPVSGLGDEADYYTYTSPDFGPAVGVDAQQGTNRVAIYVAGGSPTPAEVESLVRQLLG